jgi:hypothetical protein
LKILLSLFLFCSLHADQFAFELYNDYFAKTDMHFTNGMALSWLDSDGIKEDGNATPLYSHLMLQTISALPFVDIKEYKNYIAGASLSQLIFTPKDTTKRTIQLDDMPYAGYLALSLFEFEWDEKSFKEYRLDLGVVGAQSGAGELQQQFHRTIRENIPQGWDTQIGTHYIVNAMWRYGEKSWSGSSGGYEMDWFNQGGVQVGNFVDDAYIGTMFRFGKNYTKNFNVHYPYLREEAALLHVSKPHKGFGWSVTTGLSAEALAYFYLFDAAQSRGYNTRLNPIDASAYLGADLYMGKHKVTLMYQAQSSYLQSQKEIDLFGGLQYSYQF